MGLLHTDVPELRGFDSGLVLTELSRLTDKQVRLSEQMLCQLWELAGAILRDSGGDAEVTDSILCSLQDSGDGFAPESVGLAKRPDDPVRGILPDSRPLLEKLNGHTGLYGRLVLYQYLAEQSRETALLAPLPLTGQTIGNRISYMKSATADKAYLRFSAVLPDCHFSETHSFEDACEEVYNGLCRFCLLPLEVSGEGRLTGFSRLIIKYGLIVAAACDIESQAPGGRRVTRFGLLCRGAGDSLPRQALQAVSVRYIELLHMTAVSPSLTELFNAAVFCGLTPVRADTLPFETGAGNTYDVYSDDGTDGQDTTLRIPPVSLVFDVSETANLATFSRFLTLEASEDIFMGAYGTV